MEGECGTHGEKIANSVSAGQPGEKRPLARAKRRWDIKMDLKRNWLEIRKQD
jgi:hypothetical protein